MFIFKKLFYIELIDDYTHFKQRLIITILGFKLRFSIKIKNKRLYKKFINKIKPRLLNSDIKVEFAKSLAHVDVAICAIYKNEPDIIEWIEYHKLIGVDRFYLYDNDSDYDERRLLQPYIDSGTVIYHQVKGRCMQMPVYRDAAMRYKNDTKWLAFLDLDEYICPIDKNNIKEIIKNYEQYPAIVVNWLLFDSNGLVNRPNKFVIEAYTRCQKNKHIKTICKPKKISMMPSPHYFIYKNHRLAVDENYNTVLPNYISQKYNGDKIRINHYHTKSLNDWQRKVIIGYADQVKDRPYNIKEVYFSDAVKDYTIQKYLPELKLILKDRLL